MKLKDYFQNKKDFTLWESEKLALYEKILSQQKQRTSFFHTFKIKTFVYCFITLVLLAWIYGVYFMDWNSDGSIAQLPTNQANADYIAKVVDFNGNFYIQREWKIIQTSNISDWDNIILKKGSEIVFDIDSGTKAKLTWPARFSLSQKDEGYQMTIAEWDFVQMESEDQDAAPMEIIMWDFTVSSENNINLHITKANNEYKIDNQWDKIKVTKNNKVTEVKTKELVAINENDITLIQNVEQFQTAFVDQKINQTFEIEQKDTQTITENLIKEISTGTTIKIENTWLAEELWIGDSKKIPTEEQTKVLYTSLDKSSLMWNLENMWESRNLWNEKDYRFAKSQIDTKLQKIYTSFGVKYQKLWTKADVENLILSLENSYHIPDSQIANLKTLISWVDYIEALPLWSAKPVQSDDSIEPNDIDYEKLTQEVEAKRSEFEKNLPSNLIFK